MSAPSEISAESNELRTFVIAIVGILIVVMGLVTITTRPYLQPLPPPPAHGPHGEVNYFDHPQEASERVNQLAKESKGEFFRLTPSDQKWIDGMTSGHGPQLIAMRFQEQQAKEKANKGKKSKQ